MEPGKIEIHTADTLATAESTYLKYILNNILEKLNDKIEKI